MWFKQIQIFQLIDEISYAPDALNEKLAPMAFTPCLPSFPVSVGWASPLDEEGAELSHAANGYIMLCMQVEEKILPAAVIKQALTEKVKKIEAAMDKKVRQKEKLSLKDEVVVDLLPRAFTKMTRIYAYIDTKMQRLILGTISQAKADQFITLFKRSFQEGFRSFELVKLSPVMTSWIKNKNYPDIFSIEKAAVLQDPNQQNRIIRCQQQDLFAQGIQSFIKEGCEIKQIAMCWHDRVNFVLADDFSLRSIQFLDILTAAIKELDADTKQEQFDADFYIMTETFSALIVDLLALFGKANEVSVGMVSEIEQIA